MAALDFITLTDLKAYFSPAGSNRDAMLRTWITVVSRGIEAEIGRRVVFRAPLEVATGDNVVAEVALADGGLAVIPPNSAGRTLVVSIVDANRTITAGLLTVTGTVGGVAGVTEVFDLGAYIQQTFDQAGFVRIYGSKFFTAIASAVVSGVLGAAAVDKIRVGSSLGYVEYHTVKHGDTELSSLEWPVLAVNEVNEDTSRVYGPSTKLVLNTDYALDVNEGCFTRIAGVLPFPWLCSWRAQKLIHAAGYATTAAVPGDLKDVCRRLVVYLFQEVEKGRIGISGASDPAGNWTRFGVSQLKREMRGQFEEYRRRRFNTDTGERAFDLEAA